ncbi:unnamed protein product [Effrenium voratum]|nr:unnamed protein product [Effrenium voratum]
MASMASLAPLLEAAGANPSMLAGLLAAAAVVVLLPLAFCCICPRKAGQSKKAKKKSKAKSNGEESPAAEESKAQAEEPIPIKKQSLVPQAELANRLSAGNSFHVAKMVDVQRRMP